MIAMLLRMAALKGNEQSGGRLPCSKLRVPLLALAYKTGFVVCTTSCPLFLLEGRVCEIKPEAYAQSRSAVGIFTIPDIPDGFPAFSFCMYAHSPVPVELSENFRNCRL